MSWFADVLVRAGELFSAPIDHPLMWWELGPLLVTLIVIELYFGRYKKEPVGWNSAVNNALVLVFVGSNLMHYLFLEEFLDFSSARSWIPLGLIAFGLLLVALDFFHALPASIAFGVSSVLLLNALALVGVLIVYTGAAMDSLTLMTAVVMVFFIVLLFKLIHLLQSSAADDA